MPTPEQRLEALARDDKWSLSACDGILWAPAFPVWLREPGFWDECHVYYHPFAPLFSVALVGPDGRDVPLNQTGRRWRPDRLVCSYATPEGAVLTETKTASPGGVFRSAWRLDPARHRDHRLVAYSAQPGDAVVSAERVDAGVRWRRTLADRRAVAMTVDATLRALDGPPRVSCVRSEGSAVQPVWRFTPYVERWHPGAGVREEVRLEGIDAHGLVYAAVDVPATDHATFEIELRPAEAEHRFRPRSEPDPWPGHLASFPTLTCSDPYLERYFDYRAFGLLLCRLEGGAGNVRHPAVAEGISYFHVPITYSGQCHMYEMRWSRTPDVARGTLLNFIDTQKDDGGFHGRIYTNHLIGTDFYYANWGDAAEAVDAVHPCDAWLGRIYDGLAKHARWLDADRDAEGSGMLDVQNMYETGQEYMARYQAVNPSADVDGWEKNTRLKAIDATVYAYHLNRALERFAPRVGDDPAPWSRRAARIGAAITGAMWDEETGMFSDVDPRTGARTGVKAAVCFYPLLTDLVSDAHVGRMLAHLANPEEFWTPWPLPSSAVDDPTFNADAEWKGKRHVCPWNGRVWPMTNSHVIDGLIRQWRRRDPEAGPDAPRHRCGPIAAELLDKFVKLMFHDRDLARPNCFEHYNPLSGHACEYRGIDDYQHSWVIDLLVRGLCGLDVERRGDAWTLVCDPLPMHVDTFVLDDVCVRGAAARVERHGQAFTVTVDGATHAGTVGTPVRHPLDAGGGR